MAEIKQIMCIFCNGKGFLITDDAKVTLHDGTTYTGVIQGINSATFDLKTKGLGIIPIFIEDVNDVKHMKTLHI